ncbi:MAG: DUF169 domain-containing protein [Candidatus Omnitrophica bacterium]|nr:DUF169 domain-containing protein [Candidatus Omnitrophota bacterium]MBU1128351.1 DUF169 domain-containing protein [Candidatus Omnitrophota bacterium]MBU1657374.1 DUF169 domain-containing protein [Candidatus Omnitrophota bacterium]MBU1784771.1 DUF169 domain-containing protein [Candidatus Omnitrophota bacterium]MBU1851846.1 DUF169 domain-containing protein [Candidatus Omnitrophota bacterium]
MDNINWKFTKKYGKHWIKIKFHKNEPELKEGKRIEGIRFCEAIKKSVEYPLLIDKGSISCKGAQYVLGWDSQAQEEILSNCKEKTSVGTKKLRSILSDQIIFEEPFEYIGLNMEGTPDLLVSFCSPEEVHNLIKTYNGVKGASLNTSFSGMLSICGGIVANTFLKNEISLSFGCDDSRKYARMGRDTLVVGIPNRLFEVFVK